MFRFVQCILLKNKHFNRMIFFRKYKICSVDLTLIPERFNLFYLDEYLLKNERTIMKTLQSFSPSKLKEFPSIGTKRFYKIN